MTSPRPWVVRSWRLLILCSAVVIPWRASDAQQLEQPDSLTPRVMIVSGYYDPVTALDKAVEDAAQRRVPELVSRRRLWLVSTKDLVMSFTTSSFPKEPGEFGEAGMLVRAVGAVVVTTRGRPDSLEVTARIELTRKAPLDSMRFFARSPTAAVDSIVRRLLIDPRFERRLH